MVTQDIQSLIDVLFSSGAAQGDRAYWDQDRGNEQQNLLNAALQGLNTEGQRGTILDSLFSTGLAQGDRGYWDQNRGAEEQNLMAVLQAALGGSLSGGGTTTDTGTSTKTPAAPTLDLRQQALQAALAAIGADFNLQRGSYGAERDQFANIFGQRNAEIAQGRQLATESNYDLAADRGILRSGVLKRNLTRADQQYADASARNTAMYNPAAGNQGSEYRRIDSALKLLGQQEEAQRKEATIDSEREQLEADKAAASVKAGL